MWRCGARWHTFSKLGIRVALRIPYKLYRVVQPPRLGIVKARRIFRSVRETIAGI